MTRAVRIQQRGSLNVSRRMLVASAIVAGASALASITDLATGLPFSGMLMLDIPFLLTSAIILYLAHDAWNDLPPRRAISEQTETVREGAPSYAYRDASGNRSRRSAHVHGSRSGRARVSRA